MQVSIENKEGLKRLVSVTVPAEEFKKAYTQELRKVAKTARIDGLDRKSTRLNSSHVKRSRMPSSA